MRDCVIHLAGTGDHGFERRMNLGFPLIAKARTSCCSDVHNCSVQGLRLGGAHAFTKPDLICLHILAG